MNSHKKILLCICMSVLILSNFTACGNASKIISKIDDKSYEEAIQVFNSKDLSEKDSEKISEEMTERIENGIIAYANNECTYDDIRALISVAYDMNIDSLTSFIVTASTRVKDLNTSKESYDTAIRCFSNKSYDEAIKYFNLVVEEDCNYSFAQEKIKEAEEKSMELIFEEIETYKNSNDYESAFSLLNSHDELSSNEDYAKMFNEIKTKFINDVNSTIDSYFEDYNYYDANYYINNLSSKFPNVKEITDMSNNLQDIYTEKIKSKSQEYANQNDYESAVEIIKKGKKTLGDDVTELDNLYEEYSLYLPKYLYDMDDFSSNGSISNSSWTSKDNTGVEHKSSYSIDGWNSNNGDYYAEYLINGSYDTFSGIVAVSYNNRNDKYIKYFQVYGDGNLLYTSPNMQSGSMPVEFSVNITGVNMLKIVYPTGEGNSSIATIYDGVLTCTPKNNEQQTSN